jgi:integrase
LRKTKHCKIIEDYLANISNDGSRTENSARLTVFERFIQRNDKKYSSIDAVLTKIKNQSLNPYEFLNHFKIYLTQNYNLEVSTVKQRVSAAKNFIEWRTNQPIDSRFLTKKLHYETEAYHAKFPLDRDIVIKLLTSSCSRRLNTFLFLLAAFGCRPMEIIKVKLQNIYNPKNPQEPTSIIFPAKITKTKREREINLTSEATTKLNIWINYKYRTRNHIITNESKLGSKSLTVGYTPEKRDNDLLLSIKGVIDDQNPSGIYQNLLREFHKLLNDIGLNQKSENGRYRIEFKSFRDFVKSQISDQGHRDYSEYHIGHKGSTYYSRTRADRIEVFRKIEPAITYLDKDSIAKTTQDILSQSDAQAKEIVQLKHQLSMFQGLQKANEERIQGLQKANEESLAKIERENKTSIDRLLSLIAKESIVGKPAIPQSQLDLLLSGKLDAIPLAVSNHEGEDVKLFIINKDLESVRNNSKKVKKLAKGTTSGKNKLYVLEDPPEAFRTKKKS